MYIYTLLYYKTTKLVVHAPISSKRYAAQIVLLNTDTRVNKAGIVGKQVSLEFSADLF
jgi:hypothetical protein